MIWRASCQKLSLVEIEAFLAASESVRFAGCGRTEIYGWVERLLCHHQYPLAAAVQGKASAGAPPSRKSPCGRNRQTAPLRGRKKCLDLNQAQLLCTKHADIIHPQLAR